MQSRSIFSKKLDSELLGTVEDEIDSQLTDLDFLVGAITYADSKSFYYYTMQEKLLFNWLNKILSKNRKLKCEISVTEDPKWEFYLNTLYPGAYEKQWKMDREVIEQLKAKNDNLHIPREINHWIYFLEKKSREDFPFRLIISHISNVEFETINHITTDRTTLT